MSIETPPDTAAWLAKGGEMGSLIRSFDWAGSAIGPIENWSPALRMMVGFMLANRFPLLLWWGPTFCSIYNDPYRPVLGAKHPWALGKPVSECWSEIWHILQPLIETPFNGGPPTWMEDIPLELNRFGFTERREDRRGSVPPRRADAGRARRGRALRAALPDRSTREARMRPSTASRARTSRCMPGASAIECT